MTTSEDYTGNLNAGSPNAGSPYPYQSTTGSPYQSTTNPAYTTWPQMNWYNTPVYYGPPCDHCLCIEPTESEMHTTHITGYGTRTVPHNKCCHCGKLYMVAE